MCQLGGGALESSSPTLHKEDASWLEVEKVQQSWELYFLPKKGWLAGARVSETTS